MLSHIYRVNHCLLFIKAANEPFIEAPNPCDEKQDWLKNLNNFLEPIWLVEPNLPRALVDIVDSVEQERKQKVFIELDGFDDCLEEKKDADISRG